jgi:hypothetical protein
MPVSPEVSEQNPTITPALVTIEDTWLPTAI